MSPMKRYATKHAKARNRRRLNAQERLKQQRAQAQHSIEALHQALKDVDFPETLVAESDGRFQAQQKRLGKIVGLMFPTLFGCRQSHELTRRRGWNNFVLFYTSRVIFKGHVTMEEIGFTLNHHWMTVNYEPFE